MLRGVSFGLLLLALAAPMPAEASAHQGRSHAPYIPEFRVEGTHGYKIDVFAIPAGEYGPEVEVSIFDRDSRTIYKAPGRIGPDGFSAGFGHLGWIDVHYAAGPERIVQDCRGRPRSEVDGRFTGTFEFHGERRFTEADYPRLDARPLSQYEEICWIAGQGGAKGATLEALSRYGTIKAIQNGVAGRVRFAAKAENVSGDLKIYRFIQAFGPAKDFLVGPDFHSARVTPPAPFVGSATFRDSRAHAKWRGNLSVDFPGFPDYPLADQPTLTFLGPGGCKIHATRRLQPPISCL
jgi:hypothetical protein